MAEAWRGIVEGVAARLAPAGLELVQPLRVAWYQAAVEPALALPDLGRPSALGVLVANGEAMWPRFVAALRAEPARVDDAHPLERWVEERVREALAPLGPRWEVRFAHEPPPRRVAIQRLAHLAGLARLSSAHLSVHPIRGPWIALRAVAVIDVDGPDDPPPPAPDVCAGCERRCVPLLEAAVAASAGEMARDPDAALARTWRAWVAVRDACPHGREHRYSEPHLEYGYRKDRALLRRLATEPAADRTTADGTVADAPGEDQ